MSRRILLSPPDVGPVERRLLLDAFDSNWIAPVGPHLDAFERAFADAVGAPDAVALSSGTAALHLGLLAAGVRPGDRVITSTLTFAATANAIVYVGAEPVFVDVSPDDWTLDPDLLAEELALNARLGRRVGAVIPSICTASAPTTRAYRHRRPVRRARACGRGRGARRLVQRPTRRQLRLVRRLFVQRQQDHHDQRRRDARVP